MTAVTGVKEVELRDAVRAWLEAGQDEEPMHYLRLVDEIRQRASEVLGWEGSRLSDALGRVVLERLRQDRKWGDPEQRLADGLELPEWVTVLSEELGELSEAVLEQRFGQGELEEVRREAVQAAAVAVAIVEFVGLLQADEEEA